MSISIILSMAIEKFAWILYVLIFVRCVISWFPMGRDNKLVQLLYTLTEPILAPIRNIIDKSPIGGRGMMIDFSPIIALFFIELIKDALVALLTSVPF